MGTLENFKSFLGCIHQTNPNRQHTDDDWETLPDFVHQAHQILMPENSEFFLDLGSGRALVALQMAFYNAYRRCMGIESNADRAKVAEDYLAKFQRAMDASNRVRSPVRLLNADITNLQYSFKTVNVFFAAVNGDENMIDFLSGLMSEADPGTRMMTTVKAIPYFPSYQQHKVYQVVQVNPPEQYTFLKASKKPLKKKKVEESEPMILPVPNKPEEFEKVYPWRSQAYSMMGAPDKYLQEFGTPDPQSFVSPAPTANTTKSKDFITFWMISRKNWVDDGFADSVNSETQRAEETLSIKTAKRQWLEGHKGFTPFLLGKTWKTFTFVVQTVMTTTVGQGNLAPASDSTPSKKGTKSRKGKSPTKRNETAKIYEIRLDCPWETDLAYTTWTFGKNLYRSKVFCDLDVKERNGNGIPTPSPPQDIDIDDADLTDFATVVVKFIPQTLKTALGLSRSSATFVGNEDYVGGRGLVMDVVDSERLEYYLENENLGFTNPVLFTKEAAKSYGGFLAHENLTSLTVTNHRRDPSISFPVQATRATGYRTMLSTFTLNEMEDYFARPFESRDNIRALLHIPIIKTRMGYNYVVPAFLGVHNIVTSVLEKPKSFRDLSKSISMISKLSVLRFHCHRDGALVFMAPVQGRKLVFLLMNPTEKDYDYLEDCRDERKFKAFIPDSMVGRVLCKLVQPGELLVFSGATPHAIIAIDDVLVFGGRLIISNIIPTLLSFPQENQSSTCEDDGYKFKHVKKLLYRGSGLVLRDLLLRKVVKSDEGGVHFRNISREYLQFIAANRDYLKIGHAEWTQMQGIFAILKYNTIPAISMHFGGFYYHSNDEEMENITNALFEEGPYFATPFNLVNGRMGRMTSPPDRGDHDHCSRRDLLNLDLEGRLYGVMDFYSQVMGRNPRCLVKRRHLALGVFSAMDIEAGDLVCEFTGLLLNDAEIEEKYNTVNPPGRIYMLSFTELEGGTTRTVVVDANRHGGSSLFFKSSRNPNCNIVEAVVGTRKVLAVIAQRGVAEGEELKVQRPMNPTSAIPEGCESANQYYDELLEEEAGIEPDLTTVSLGLEENSSDEEIPLVDLTGNVETVLPPAGELKLGTSAPPIIQDNINVNPSADSSGTNPTHGVPGIPHKKKTFPPSLQPTKPPVKTAPPTFETKTSPPKATAGTSSGKTPTKLRLGEILGNKRPGQLPRKPRKNDTVRTSPKVLPPLAAKSNAGEKKDEEKNGSSNSFDSKKPPTKDESEDESEGEDSDGNDSDGADKDDSKYRDYSLEVPSKERREMERIGGIPNAASSDQFYRLTRSQREAVRELGATEFDFDTFDEFEEVNKKILRLYKVRKMQREENLLEDKKLRKTCGVCPHNGRFIDHKYGQDFHPFYSHRNLQQHFERYHKSGYRCDACGYPSDNLRAHTQHVLEQVKKERKEAMENSKRNKTKKARKGRHEAVLDKLISARKSKGKRQRSEDEEEEEEEQEEEKDESGPSKSKNNGSNKKSKEQ